MPRCRQHRAAEAWVNGKRRWFYQLQHRHRRVLVPYRTYPIRLGFRRWCLSSCSLLRLPLTGSAMDQYNTKGRGCQPPPPRNMGYSASVKRSKPEIVPFMNCSSQSPIRYLVESSGATDLLLVVMVTTPKS